MVDILQRHEWKFTPVDRDFGMFSDGGLEHFKKWGLDQTMQVITFQYDESFRRGMADDFIKGFFNDAAVKQVLRLIDENGSEARLGVAEVQEVDFEPIETNLVRMELFDKLTDCGIVRPNGSIAKMLDQFLDGGVTVSDELRCLLMNEDESTNAGLFTSDEKSEFLYHIFWRITSGGALCQFEDMVEPYLRFTKLIYKDLVTVRKSAATGELEVSSFVYKINSISGPVKLFGRPSFDNHNFCYLSINPSSHTVNVWYNGFASPF
eukprot:TRINITY_DN16586_c0_g1_i1.p1 TRINITY_DN16586_c0_g1~~TRINITY_DN16586_c0_g1_i1.p1  ORF type:complete len:264 (+),score=44.61 TRINITY_DN16586_c0_g1_i1:45-836(+)